VTLPIAKSVGYADGQLQFTVVSNATISAEVIVQGYTSTI
jgi:hypothetical protein